MIVGGSCNACGRYWEQTGSAGPHLCKCGGRILFVAKGRTATGSIQPTPPPEDRESLIALKRNFTEWLKTRKNITQEERAYHEKYLKELSDKINALSDKPHPWRKGFKDMPTGPNESLFKTGSQQ